MAGRRNPSPAAPTATIEPPTASSGLPFARWPKWAKFVASQRIAGEPGVGDTVKRLATAAGGEQFKTIFKFMTGHACRCEDRRADWNRRFAYARLMGH